MTSAIENKSYENTLQTEVFGPSNVARGHLTAETLNSQAMCSESN